VIIDEQRLAYQALNALSANIAVLDAAGTIVAVNDAWSRFAAANGGPAGFEAYVGANYLDACREAIRAGDDSAREALTGLQEVRFGDRDEFTMECPCHAAGEQRWFRMTVTRFGSGPDRRLVVAHKNITTEKRQQQALEAGERLLRTVLEALPIGVWILGPDGRILQANAAGIGIWGGARFVGLREFGQYKGWRLATGKAIAPDEWAAARAIQHGETSIDEEIEIECFDGTRTATRRAGFPAPSSSIRTSPPASTSSSSASCCSASTIAFARPPRMRPA
jgi:PAS domain-containing protein